MATIRKRGNSYQIRVSCGTDVYGKKLVESMTWKPDSNMTERQITKELNRIAVQFEEKVKRGISKRDTKIKLKDFCDIYLGMQQKILSPVTFYNYQKVIENYIIPALGHLKLIDITPLHVQQFVNALSEQEAGYNTKSKYLSSATVKSYYIVLRSIFNFACKKGLLDSNPTSSNHIDIPKTSLAHTDILDEKSMNILLECLENEPIYYKVLIHLALSTGCRRAELVALHWNDILWEKKQIIISKSVYHIKGKKGIKSPKTNSSNRTIAIPDYMIQMLKQYKKYQMEQQLYKQIPNPCNILFMDRKGSCASPMVITNWFQRFLKRNNLSHIKFHALRHTSASLLLSSSTNIKIVSNRLGHTNLSTTNRYLHTLTEADIDAAKILEQKLNFDKVGQMLDKHA